MHVLEVLNWNLFSLLETVKHSRPGEKTDLTEWPKIVSGEI